MKIYLNRAPKYGPWGGGAKFVNSFYEYFLDENDSRKHEVCDPSDSSATPEVILLAGVQGEGTCISADQAIMYKQFYSKPGTKLVLRVNENDARKNTSNVDETLIKFSEYLDGTVFVSDWLKDYFEDQGWKCSNNVVIHNGVDQEIFKPGEKLDNGKINIVTHHWSQNFLKGFDIYEKLDEWLEFNHEKFSFTYIGRHRGTFGNKTKIVNPLVGKALGEELGKYDVYISASRFDPGPNHITESISCKLPTYIHKDGGGCVEFAGLDHAYNSWEELERLLINGNFKSNKTSFTNWESCIEQYVNFLETV